MEGWKHLVLQQKDISLFPAQTEKFCHDMFVDIARMKLNKEVLSKFKQRLGPEFDEWVATKNTKFPNVMVSDIIADDTFWNTTWKLARS